MVIAEQEVISQQEGLYILCQAPSTPQGFPIG